MFVLVAVALADSENPPYAHYELSVDGRFALVVIPEEENEDWFGTYHIEQSKDTHARFDAPGCYQMSGPPQIHWEVDWYATSFLIANDGEHVVRYGRWPWKQEYGEEALAFFRRGTLLRAWRVNQLVHDFESLPHSVSHYQWRESGRIDNSRRVFELKTLDGGEFEFDLTTGDIVRSNRSMRRVWFFWGIAILILVIGVGLIPRHGFRGHRYSRD